jgi:hypothetical protein
MRNALGRLVLRMAEILDRSLITVPDLDLDDAYSPSPLSHNSHSDDESCHHRLRTTAMGPAANDDRCNSWTGIAGTRR